MSFAMPRPAREAFPAGLHVGVVAVTDPGRGPLAVPGWSACEPGGVVRFATAGSSVKTALLRAADRGLRW